MTIPYRKWREEQVLFLDDAFDCPLAAEQLTKAGFVVKRFSECFQGENGKRAQSVKDPDVIAFCNKHGYILTTTDGNIINLHRPVIQRSKSLGILATAHNTVIEITVWVNAIIKLKPQIEKGSFKKKGRPWFAKIDTTGKFSVSPKTVEPTQRKSQAAGS